MQVSVTFRRIDASDTLRSYAEEKLNRIKKYVEDPIEAHDSGYKKGDSWKNIQ